MSKMNIFITKETNKMKFNSFTQQWQKHSLKEQDNEVVFKTCKGGFFITS